MIIEIGRVLLCVALGEIVSRFSPITLPGPVIGLVLLYLWLHARGDVPPALATIADRMLEMFGLFFVPAGVGIVAYRDSVLSDVLAISVAVSLGTAITIVTSGLVAALVGRWKTPTSATS